MKRRNFIKNLIGGALGLAAAPVVAKVIEPELKIGKFEDYIGGSNTVSIPAGEANIVESNFVDGLYNISPDESPFLNGVTQSSAHDHTHSLIPDNRTISGHKHVPVGYILPYSGSDKDIPKDWRLISGQGAYALNSKTYSVRYIERVS